ncbi:MAG: hypothetical protein R3C32_04625 [Chloroflexota bacterium]
MRALLSVADADQDGIVRLVERLAALGTELLATRATRDGLARRGVTIDAIGVVPADGPGLAGEARTYHPEVYAGILARRDSADELDGLRSHGIGLVDLVVVSVAPFEPYVGGRVVPIDEALAMIDVAGVSLLSPRRATTPPSRSRAIPRSTRSSWTRSSAMASCRQRPACASRPAPSRRRPRITPTCPRICITSGASSSPTT